MSQSPFEFVPLRLKRREERRLRAGHLWVYSNEVDVEATPLRDLTPGQAVRIQAQDGKELGTGYVNPHALLCARLVSRDPQHPFGPSLLVHRLNVALGLRQRLYPRPFYRLVYGESDGLPGLVVDRYDDVCVVQVTTAGMETLRPEILAALDKVVRPAAVLWRNDNPVRTLEGLDLYVETEGTVPELAVVEEGEARLQAPLAAGQKTGWFYDQRDNRARLARYLGGQPRVLDLFSYVGAWGVLAARGGAREVLCVDSSAAALGRVAENAALNDVAERVATRQGDAFEVLRALREEQRRFDLVIVDPPAFIKRRKDLREGTLAYRRINQGAMQLLERDGILVSCSCSHHLGWRDLTGALLQGARHLDRNLQILEQGHQGPDHPVHPAIAETDYLKACFARVLPA